MKRINKRSIWWFQIGTLPAEFLLGKYFSGAASQLVRQVLYRNIYSLSAGNAALSDYRMVMLRRLRDEENWQMET